MLHAVAEFLLLRFLCDSKKMKPAVGPGPDGFAVSLPPAGPLSHYIPQRETKTKKSDLPSGKSLFFVQSKFLSPQPATICRIPSATN
jgi:hypothetical protein